MNRGTKLQNFSDNKAIRCSFINDSLSKCPMSANAICFSQSKNWWYLISAVRKQSALCLKASSINSDPLPPQNATVLILSFFPSIYLMLWILSVFLICKRYSFNSVASSNSPMPPIPKNPSSFVLVSSIYISKDCWYKKVVWVSWDEFFKT